jgi:hypothetical protein
MAAEDDALNLVAALVLMVELINVFYMAEEDDALNLAVAAAQ